MQIICICRCSYGYGKELAQILASKLGYECISREELTDKATEHGIPIGKIETAIMKRRPMSEELAIEMDRYKAFMTAAMCEKALKGDIVYHGRTGHIILPGLTHVMRIRAIAELEDRITMVMQRLNLSRNQAKKYVLEVDEDRRRWVRYMYNINWDDPSLYDVIVNSAHMSVENSASALVSMAQLPEFKATPALVQKMEDLLLESKCRLEIGKDEKTRGSKVTVQSEKGNVTVTYLPRFGKQAEAIPSVLEKMSEIRSLICTVATTNILYIQERFNHQTDSFKHLIEIAEKWNASVELLRLAHQGGEEIEPVKPGEEIVSEPVSKTESNGGILDDTTEPVPDDGDSSGLTETLNKLIQVGRAGAVQTVHGGIQSIADSFRSRSYSLVVVGDVFLSSGSATRKRMKRDLISFLIDQARVPVIGTEDLKEQYLFGPKQWVKIIWHAVLCVLIYYGVFTYQEPILKFLTMSSSEFRIMAVIAVTIFSPLAAYIISGFTQNLLKLIKLE